MRHAPFLSEPSEGWYEGLLGLGVGGWGSGLLASQGGISGKPGTCLREELRCRASDGSLSRAAEKYVAAAGFIVQLVFAKVKIVAAGKFELRDKLLVPY